MASQHFLVGQFKMGWGFLMSHLHNPTRQSQILTWTPRVNCDLFKLYKSVSKLVKSVMAFNAYLSGWVVKWAPMSYTAQLFMPLIYKVILNVNKAWMYFPCELSSFFKPSRPQHVSLLIDCSLTEFEKFVREWIEHTRTGQQNFSVNMIDRLLALRDKWRLLFFFVARL